MLPFFSLYDHSKAMSDDEFGFDEDSEQYV